MGHNAMFIVEKWKNMSSSFKSIRALKQTRLDNQLGNYHRSNTYLVDKNNFLVLILEDCFGLKFNDVLFYPYEAKIGYMP